jgi:hypothetical protein
MAITSETIRNEYVGNGVLATYPFEFIIYSQDEIDVYVDGVLQTVDIHYTIASEDIEDDDGGNIVFGVLYIPANLSEIVIISSKPYTQETVLASRDETYEETYDKNVILIKQLKELIGRAFLLEVSSLYSGLTLPDPRAGYYLTWKSDESGLENVAGTDGASGLLLPDVDVTIVSGVITVSDGPSHYLVDTEGAAASDDLTKVLGMQAGEIFSMSAKDDARTVVIKNGTYFKTAGGLDCTLSDSLYEILFRMGSGNVAYELGRSSNA